MNLKKPAKLKRAKQPRSSDKTKHFNKDWERLSHSGRYDMNHLKVAMMLLIANDEPLPPEYLDHELSGEWSGFRECHIGGDFLLIYDLHADGSIIFTRTGTHADLFE
jgi:mRNA interferase YafQ